MDDPTVQTILRRRATRANFTGRPIPEAVLGAIVRCGLAAPSSKNAHPCRLHVVSHSAVLDDLACAVETSEGAESYVPDDPLTGEPRPDWPSTVVESADVLRQASTAIFIENRGPFSRGRRILINAIQAGRLGSLVGYGLEVVGIGAAVENMWIAAEALGLRGCFMGDVVNAEEAIARRLGLESDLMGVLALGYVDHVTGCPPRDLDVGNPDRVVWHGLAGDRRNLLEMHGG
jgi:nitroreductase